MKNKQSKTIMRTYFGSEIYGTKTPQSDTDFKAVHIPSKHDILLQKATGVVISSTKKDSTQKNSAEDIDDESFTILKFCAMLKMGDMITNELLFIPKEKLLICTPEWEYILNNRDKLISRNIAGFLGYIRTQVSRYGIKGSRVASVRAMKEFLETQDQHKKLYELGFREIIDNHKDNMKEIELVDGMGTKSYFIEVCNRKVGYTLSVKQALEIINRLFNEYGHRALQAEQNNNFDVKSVCHAYRVSDQAIELLETGNITFPRPNAEFLKSIRRAEHSYAKIAGMLEDNLDRLEELSKTTNIFPEKIDVDMLDDLVYKLHNITVREDN